MAGKLEKKFEVLNEFGIHARPAALLVKTASEFDSDIIIENNGAEVSAKSIMGLLTLEGYQGSVLTVTTEGDDASEAMSAIEALFVNKFYED
ncbi:HPr family phosphocarrier protein [Verrucomicrobiota bacterium]